MHGKVNTSVVRPYNAQDWDDTEQVQTWPPAFRDQQDDKPALLLEHYLIGLVVFTSYVAAAIALL